MHISELETPALLIDVEVMERNLERVAAYSKANGFRLRPHTKTHKTPELGKRQLRSGAAGLTVAKVGEAEVMAGSGTPDMLLAYPVVGQRKLERLMGVAKQTDLTVSLDSLEAARELSAAAQRAGIKVGVLAEADVGMGRVGVPPGQPLLELACGLSRLAGLELRGFAFYPGHIRLTNEEGMRALDALSAVVEEGVREFQKAGLPVGIVSGGSTPALYHSHRVKGMNEIRPGTYIFNDRNTVACGGCEWEDCAATVMVTIVSTARKNGFIIDGGSKTFSSDRLLTGGQNTFGLIREAPEARFFNMNEEHGYVDLGETQGRFRVGDRLRVIPNHVCVAVNLHERIYGLRGDTVETTWKVEGRGKLQ
ncbi:MAG: alanine racemase [Bryobacteraceae bacterium]|nr:alanine racemase [Bryobacteraceae bacterium]